MADAYPQRGGARGCGRVDPPPRPARSRGLAAVAGARGSTALAGRVGTRRAGGIDASSKAPVLAGMLKRRAAARTPAPFGTREGLLDRILALSGGKALSGRQIAAIAAGDRR